MAGFVFPYKNIMKQWILLRRSADYKTISETLGVDPVVVRIMVNRGFDTLEKMRDYLADGIEDSFSYEGLPDLDKAIDTITFAKENNLKCRIVGDYDADGVCSTAILLKGLKRFGLDCDYKIPNRITDGYGINESIVDKAIEDGIGIIVTCDNGISARTAIDKAEENNILVVVTDHHTITESEVPTKAHALVNPKRDVNKYPFPDICGAQVSFKFLCALYDAKATGEKSIKDTSTDELLNGFWGELLELASIATVTDVMPLIGENRRLVKWIIKRLASVHNKGLNKICKSMGISEKGDNISAADISFGIGPCINAAGRIDVADYALSLLISEDDKELGHICDKLIEFNTERKGLTDKAINDAVSVVEEKYADSKIPDILLVNLPECHVSICGLVASKVRDRFYRPTFIFTTVNDGMLTGSGRSTDEYNMIEGIQKCADLLEKFGGHSAACGLSLKEDNLDALSDRLNEESNLTEDELIEKLKIDADMPLSYVRVETIKDIKKCEPFGKSNNKPVFAVKDMLLVRADRKGDTLSHVFLSVKDTKGYIYTIKYWGGTEVLTNLINEKYAYTPDDIYDKDIMNLDIRLGISYYPEINTFRNNERVEYRALDIKLS